MPSDMDNLRKKSDTHGVSGTPAALANNKAILNEEPGDPVASNRLGIALLNAGDFDAAEAVFKAALEAHPDNEIAKSRLEDVARRRRFAEAPAPTRKRATKTATKKSTA